MKLLKINDICNSFGNFARLFYILQHLFPLAVIIRVEDVITALPYPKGRWYFDAIALFYRHQREQCATLKTNNEGFCGI